MTWLSEILKAVADRLAGDPKQIATLELQLYQKTLYLHSMIKKRNLWRRRYQELNVYGKELFDRAAQLLNTEPPKPVTLTGRNTVTITDYTETLEGETKAVPLAEGVK